MNIENVDLKIKEKADEIANFLISKNKNYGDSIFRTSRITGDKPTSRCLDHIEEKIDRIMSLAITGAESQETLFDSLRDLAGYIIIFEVMMDELRIGKGNQ